MNPPATWAMPQDIAAIDHRPIRPTARMAAIEYVRMGEAPFGMSVAPRRIRRVASAPNLDGGSNRLKQRWFIQKNDIIIAV
jgi:hypothetical protein